MATSSIHAFASEVSRAASWAVCERRGAAAVVVIVSRPVMQEAVVRGAHAATASVAGARGAIGPSVEEVARVAA